MPHRVVVLALDGLLPFELGIPQRIFGRSLSSEPFNRGTKLYDVVTCSVRPPGPVATDADFSIVVAHGPEALATADTVVIPASYELGPVYSEGRLTAELAAAFAYIRPGTRMVSICTGATSWPPPDTSTAAPPPRTGRPPTISSGSSRTSA